MPNHAVITPQIYTIEKITNLFENDDTFSFDRVDNIVIKFGSNFNV